MAGLVFVEELCVVLDLHLDIVSGLALVLKRSDTTLRLILPVDLAIKQFVLVLFAERKRESFDLRSEDLDVTVRDLTVAVSKLLDEQMQSHVAEREQAALSVLLIVIAAHKWDELDLLVAERVRVRKVEAEAVGGRVGGSHNERLSRSYGGGTGSEMVLVVNLNEQGWVDCAGREASKTLLKLSVAEKKSPEFAREMWAGKLTLKLTVAENQTPNLVRTLRERDSRPQRQSTV